jgi:hypothetical protein
MKLIQLETQFTKAFIVLLALKCNSCKFKIKNCTPLLCTLSYTLSGCVHKFWCCICIHQLLLNTDHWKVLLAEHQFSVSSSSSSLIDHRFSNSWQNKNCTHLSISIYMYVCMYTYSVKWKRIVFIYKFWTQNTSHCWIKVCNPCSCSGLHYRTVQVIVHRRWCNRQAAGTIAMTLVVLIKTFCCMQLEVTRS